MCSVKKYMLIVISFFVWIECGMCSTETNNTEEWILWKDKKKWANFDEFLAEWKGDSSSESQEIQEALFDAKYRLMDSIANPQDAKRLLMTKYALNTLCANFESNRETCVSNFQTNQETLCQNAVKLSLLQKKCTDTLTQVLTLNAPEEVSTDLKDASEKATDDKS